MKKILLLCFCCFSLLAYSQKVAVDNISREDGSQAFNPELEPFYHGVASGDPLADGVIIWTRVTPTSDMTINGTWEVAEDTSFTTIVQNGTFTTDLTKDYTVKIDVSNLAAASTYYYRFNALGNNSLIGRTRTAPSGASANLKFGVVSCNNYQSGYFNAFAEMATMNDLDVVVHLGDFIYEYPEGGYGYRPEVGRGHDPDHEIIELGDYRTRYSFYRLDPDLRRVMQQHPFVFIWDDHEVANDSWEDGAQNHDVTEGDYADRKAGATQAYFEWCPIRDNIDDQVYRTLNYGDLADLIMLDTRHEAREMQVDSIQDPILNDPNRTLLGATQKAWFENELSNSTATWKVVGNQVVFAHVLTALYEPLFPGVQNLFLDIWNGYPQERQQLINHITTNAIDDIVFITGDVHASFSFDVTANPEDSMAYDPSTGMGSIAVEFVTPSISSDNYNEILGDPTADSFETLFPVANPHNKWVELSDHGFFLLDLTPAKAQADYYYVDSVNTPTEGLNFVQGVYSNLGDNYLQLAAGPAPPKPVQEIPAPDHTTDSACVAVSLVEETNPLLFLRSFPNPTHDLVNLNYALNDSEQVKIVLYSTEGKKIKSLLNEKQTKGHYLIRFSMAAYPTGNYFIHMETSKGVSTSKIVKID